MSFEHRPSPSRVTEAGAAKLSRWLLFVLLALYIVPGLFGRAPWSPEDASAFGVAWTMATGSSAEWWLPSVAGEPLPEEGPLPFWLGALFIRLFGPLLGAIDAARLVTVVWFAVGTWALWYATYRLARRDEAQPVALAFGGEAAPRDYGRMLADVAVLLLLATFGVLVRLHETSAEPALLAQACFLVFALAYSLDDPWKGSAAAGLAVAAAALTRGWFPAGVLLAVALGFTLSFGARRVLRAIVLALLALLVFSLWPLGAKLAQPQAAPAYLQQWWQWNWASVRWPHGENAIWLLRNLGWYTWPLWPFALWTVYAWRHFLKHPHMLLPLLATIGGIVAVLLSSGPGDRELLLTVPGLVVLAAFGVSSLKRTAEDAIDWFSMALFSLTLVAVWLYFFAWNTGTPPKMAASIMRLVPGFGPGTGAIALLIAAAAAIAWFVLAVWRLRVRPPMLWTGPFIAASGMSLLWISAVSLFSPAIDYVRSYTELAPVLAQQVERAGGADCVRAINLPSGTRAMLAYQGGIRFAAPQDEVKCRVALQRDSQRTADDDAPPAGAWTRVYDVTRRARYDEVFRIWIRDTGERDPD